jgi:hypothetical protein
VAPLIGDLPISLVFPIEKFYSLFWLLHVQAFLLLLLIILSSDVQ